MPVPKKRTISQPDLAKGESAEEKMPEEQEFRQHLRALAVSAVRVLIEKVMCEELDQCVGAQWGECTPNRKGYRNGYYQRDLITAQDVSRIFLCPEIGRGNSIQKWLGAKAAMNQRSAEPWK